MSNKFEFILEVNERETFKEGYVYLRQEEVYKYVDNKRTDELEGFRVYALDIHTATEFSVKVLGDVQEIGKMKKFKFQNLTIKPYLKRSGTYSSLEYSATATGIEELKQG